MNAKKILDAANRIIISELTNDGRTKYTALAKKLKVTPAAVKERVERLINKKIIKVSALINYREFYPLSAAIGVEADADGVNSLVKRLKRCPLVFHLTKTSGMHNLIISLVASDIEHIEEFLNKQIRSEPGIKHVEVNISNNMIVPEYLQLKIPSTKLKETPCGLRMDDDMKCSNCPPLEGKE